MVGLLGKKVGMTHIFDEDGKFAAVTLVEAGPCFVLQIKNKGQDGYDALQIGFGEKRDKSTNKPDGMRFKKIGINPMRFVKEIKIKDAANYKLGQRLEADIFAKGDFVDVIGTSIGKGFQGGVKRWGWAGGDQGHGSMFHRAPGSIQSGPRLSRVTKGHHMPGHMGNDRVTIQNLEVMEVDKANNLIALKGALPGHKNSFLILRESKKRPKGFVKHKISQIPAKKPGKPQVQAAKKK